MSNSGSDNNSGTSTSTPFATLVHAASITMPGDVVDVMAGTYSPVDITRSGTAGTWISYEGYPAGTHPVIQLDSSSWEGVAIYANYVCVDGFEVIGDAKSFTSATAKPSDLSDPQYNEDGISAGNYSGSTVYHHIIVSNNIIHDTSGAGIGDGHADYVTITGNIVYDTSFWSGYAESGITATPMDSDGNTGYKTLITNNLVYGNANYVSNYTNCSGSCGVTDGEGIILDSSISVGHYGGRTLIANNIAYANGSSGIQVGPNSAHADIVNNTLYQNGRNIPDRGEIDVSSSTDVTALNNIIYSTAGEAASGTFTSADYNDYFVVSPKTESPHDLLADPKFVDPSAADFQLQLTSPAIGAGTSALAPSDNFAGATRGSNIDIGAY